ncbi:MAG TPA: aminoacyl-tRNA hydrolase [Dehalococcoidia bacterium]|nr:aminoacyl-tRNA hydrolase [Dehalococcoidia bacterium]
MRLVVGLGNPGEEYAHNRHNVGYWTVNRLARKHGIAFDVRTSSYFLGEGRIGGRSVALAKPRTYMNRSGDAVWNLVKRLKLDEPSELLVVYDELDLPVGKVRIRARGGPGGQKGVAHIIERLGTDRFPRVRIGIGRPVVDGQPTWEPEAVAAYVLSDPPPEERALLDEAVARAVEAIEVAIAEGLEAAMNRFNR